MTTLARSRYHSWRAPLAGPGMVLASMIAQNFGATIAKQMFVAVGAFGVTGLRVFLAAAVLMLLRTPWRRPLSREVLPSLFLYGCMLGLMNLLIYQAFARLPIGIAIGIEVLGPLSIVLAGSRRALDLVWFAAAATGLVLLLPLRVENGLDPLGLAFAAGAATCWALYIVFGKRVATTLGADAVAWGMVVAACINMPLAVTFAGGALLDPLILLSGLGIALLTSVLPCMLEMEAMRRLPSHVFGVLLSAAPAVAAIAGFFVLGETLLPVQWLAIVAIVCASCGSAVCAAQSTLADRRS
ncbi:EamA family transporter [Novosphingobium sp. ZW T3_23]|uniref:EamA family transporter n=1 Tax=Novosphingobium sp. ZW T3_23 TaxID=3378084 RepID=UPI003853D7E7